LCLKRFLYIEIALWINIVPIRAQSYVGCMMAAWRFGLIVFQSATPLTLANQLITIHLPCADQTILSWTWYIFPNTYKTAFLLRWIAILVNSVDSMIAFLTDTFVFCYEIPKQSFLDDRLKDLIDVLFLLYVPSLFSFYIVCFLMGFVCIHGYWVVDWVYFTSFLYGWKIMHFIVNKYKSWSKQANLIYFIQQNLIQ